MPRDARAAATGSEAVCQLYVENGTVDGFLFDETERRLSSPSGANHNAADISKQV
jgi:hypothetical protein